jgi:cytochrome c oxidase subunit 1
MGLMQILATVGTAGLLLSQVPLLINFFGSLRWGRVAGANPWRANTLEWSAPSPPPHGNFATQPSVYRWPYEYSTPGRAEDWHPQHLPPGVTAEGSRP